MNLSQLKDYYNKKPVEFTIRENYELVEDREYVPRFTLKNVKTFFKYSRKQKDLQALNLF